jgi:hypothetical protein
VLNPPSKKKKKKKRKLRGDGSGSGEEADDDPVAIVCEHCCCVVPEVSPRVACLDGTSLDVAVAHRGLVLEVKRLVGQVWVVDSFVCALVWRVHRLTALLLVCRCATWTLA